MDDISILEELGLQEVSRKTHIETRFLKYMINRDFDKLNKINTLGFVKILKREYNLDLQGWADEFESYLRENRREVPNQHKGAIFAKENEPNRSAKRPPYFLIILILLGVAFYYFDGMSYINQLRYKYYDQNTTQAFTQSPVVEETKEQLDVIEEKSPTNVEENSSSEVQAEEEGATEIVEENSTQSEENITEEKKTPILSNDEATIIPKHKIWLGIIDLTTNKRKQYSTRKDIVINLDKPQLVLTGHGSFTLTTTTGKEETPSSNKRQYYYVDGGTITSITKDEFKSYNGGRGW